MMSGHDDPSMEPIAGTEPDEEQQSPGNDRTEHRLFAYMLTREVPPVIPAPVKREWMNDTTDHFATRCLPMMIANQAGWVILNTHSVVVQWNGGPRGADMTVEYSDPPKDPPVVSCFGHGIVTWRIPILFRTPPEFDLWVRGPVNAPKLDAYALEGIVETSWSVSTFTMNWQILRPNTSVQFDKGEPICMIIPHRKIDIEQFDPVIAPIVSNPELMLRYQHWAVNRRGFVQERGPNKWQQDYIRGRISGVDAPPAHRTRLDVKPFRPLE
jgi:hypothetical protein